LGRTQQDSQQLSYGSRLSCYESYEQQQKDTLAREKKEIASEVLFPFGTEKPKICRKGAQKNGEEGGRHIAANRNSGQCGHQTTGDRRKKNKQ